MEIFLPDCAAMAARRTFLKRSAVSIGSTALASVLCPQLLAGQPLH